MKKRSWILVSILLALGAGCVRDNKLIPDEELAEIFRDVYLVNTYAGQSGRFGADRLHLDSLDLYTPIFDEYGYTAENVRYTIGNFSRRKSAKLSDVVERAIVLLEEGGAYYKREVAVLDTIDNVARRRYTRTIYSDSLIRVRRLRDTSRLHIMLKHVREGDYVVTYDYLIDSVDSNVGARALLWMENRDTVQGEVQRMTLRRLNRYNMRGELKADSATRNLVMNLYVHPRRALEQPSLTIYDLKVVHTPIASEAVDSLYGDQLHLPVFSSSFLSF